MPIYEFYCRPCHTIYSFFSRKVAPGATPPCPRCNTALSRQVSSVAYLRHGTSGEGDNDDSLGDLPIDEQRMEQAMDAMAGDFERMGDDADPREAATLMRKFSELSGLRFNGEIEEALDRMACGEDPDEVGEDLDALMESGADPFVPEGRGRRMLRRLPAQRDPTLHDMPDDCTPGEERAP